MEILARPKKDYQWSEGRSAMDRGARLVSRILGGVPGGRFRPAFLARMVDLQLEEVRPEHVTLLPEGGEGRNHDLWARALAHGGPFTLCVKATAVEPF